MSKPEYIFEASSKPSLPWHQVPLIRATEETVRGYGCLVDDPEGFELEICRWPAQGWRPIDEGTGDEAGHVEGIFACKSYLVLADLRIIPYKRFGKGFIDFHNTERRFKSFFI